MKQIFKEYFSFTRQERIGVISLVILLLVIFFLPKLTSRSNKFEDLNADTTWLNAIQKLDKSNYDSISEPNLNSPFEVNKPKSWANADEAGNPPIKLFYFDPNTISSEGWKQLGIREKTIHTIQNYLAKGGSFKKPEDLQKIYGFSNTDYNRLSPHIKIDNSGKPDLQQKSITEETKKEDKPYKKSNYGILEINSTDTTELIALPGIGSKLATRIISFRDKLGGFYSVEQVKETYGLQDSVFQKIRPYLTANSNSVKKININTVTLDELKQHPYFRYTIAGPLILYRKEHGRFE
ncbi:MAG: helix-hairpin-helix domain-containing protein, partial [Bacteroidetes bacterium]|nr:helix-hairpin-helix domain-containing protein [Bacteroidota bacterium]